MSFVIPAKAGIPFPFGAPANLEQKVNGFPLSRE
jgi:hypothetical protein